MKMTSADQLKALIKNAARSNSADAQLLLRHYMMERFLERLAVSAYKDNFIIKGGMLVTAMVGLRSRATMDLDVTLKGESLREANLLEIVEKVCAINLDDNMSFKVISLVEIMDEADYPGMRISLNAFFGKIRVPMKLDVSTGDVITPREINFQYKLMFEERSLNLWAYNIETVLAEKLESIIARTITNTRMRDFYDIYLLQKLYQDKIDLELLKKAIMATAEKRGSSEMLKQHDEIIKQISANDDMRNLWQRYQENAPYVQELLWENAVEAVKEILAVIKM